MLRSHPVLRWILGALVLAALIIATRHLKVAEGLARTDVSRMVLADTTGSDVDRVTLPVDQKFVDVAWRCDGQKACEPWYLLRVMARLDEPGNYLIWSPDLEVRYFISENRVSGYWRTEEAGTIKLSVEQRLVSVSWLCPGDGTCEPRLVTRHMKKGELARGYTFTDGRRAYYIWETAD